jgi:BON domain
MEGGSEGPPSLNTGRVQMIEPLFGSAPLNWAGSPSPTFGWFQTLPSLGTRAASTMSDIAMSPQLTQGPPAQSFGLGMPPAPGLAIANSLPPEAYAHALPFSSLTFAGSPIMTAPALLTAIAIKRGQPSGPTTDQEIEDFLYDALEFLSGTNEVEVRCEGGRVTLTGSVPLRRLKRDVGEIAWAIPTINDVQNNVTIATRRRGRSSGREAEQHSGTASRKTA